MYDLTIRRLPSKLYKFDLQINMYTSFNLLLRINVQIVQIRFKNQLVYIIKFIVVY